MGCAMSVDYEGLRFLHFMLLYFIIAHFWDHDVLVEKGKVFRRMATESKIFVQHLVQETLDSVIANQQIGKKGIISR